MIGRLGSRLPRTSRAGSRSVRPGVGIETLDRQRAYLEAIVECAADRIRDQDVDPVNTCRPLDARDDVDPGAPDETRRDDDAVDRDPAGDRRQPVSAERGR